MTCASDLLRHLAAQYKSRVIIIIAMLWYQALTAIFTPKGASDRSPCPIAGQGSAWVGGKA